jgi:hypothetical protein
VNGTAKAPEGYSLDGTAVTLRRAPMDGDSLLAYFQAAKLEP